MESAGGAIGGNQFGKSIKDATSVIGVCLETGIGQCLIKAAAVLAGGRQCPIDVVFSHDEIKKVVRVCAL